MKPQNRYHRRICEELSRRGISYVEEYPIAQYSCDIYISDLRLLVEIDGPTHWPKRDQVRDEALRASRPELRVVHVKVGVPVREAMEAILG